MELFHEMFNVFLQVNQWLLWLEQADSESSDED